MGAENGTIGQHVEFFGERAQMPREIFELEAAAMLGFNHEQIGEEISLPNIFWTSMGRLLSRLSENSLSTVRTSEEQITAAKLLGSFGNVTTKETIQPHQELTTITAETHEASSARLIESKVFFAAIINKIKELIIEHHEKQLENMPSEANDQEVNIYLSKGEQGSDNKTIKNSFDASKTTFTKIKEERKRKRRLILESLSNWFNFVEEISSTILSGNRAMTLELQTI